MRKDPVCRYLRHRRRGNGHNQQPHAPFEILLPVASRSTLSPPWASLSTAGPKPDANTFPRPRVLLLLFTLARPRQFAYLGDGLIPTRWARPLVAVAEVLRGP